jgi:hypothetical protein
MLCGLVDNDRYFTGAYCLHNQSNDDEGTDSTETSVNI